MLTLQKILSFQLGYCLRSPQEDLIFEHCEWKIQDCQKNSILFLKFTEKKDIIELIANLSPDNVGLVVSDDKRVESLINHMIPLYVCQKENWHKMLKLCCDFLYEYHDSIQFAGVTGTNGKTSTVHFLSQILQQHHQSVLTIGTLGIFLEGRKVEDFSLTSPSYIDFRKTLHKYSHKGMQVVFEMSSHALDQQRYYGVKLSCAGWTSFSQDHLDYHGSMTEYFQAKQKILDYVNEDGKLFIPDDQEEIYQKIFRDCRVVKCPPWSSYKLNFKNPIFKASFAKNNFIIAYEMAKKMLNVQTLTVEEENITNAPGRWMIKNFDNRVVIIDYAHTPDALINVCRNAIEAYKGYTLKVLFGCGGDRDRKKRPLMGEAVSQFADFIYLTSDNPRTEEPEKIIDDIVPGVSQKFYRLHDREKCLKKALQELCEHEVLIVEGKGHENYIIRGQTKYPYSDEAVCDSYIASRLK